ncbi:Pentatricopeptide repeat superfamily protein [Perilla frutescens var. hirtella]|nr:Pentatricopeptide repeat superfamily protein [Perilla frutescens var. hirtella]
MKLFSPSLPRKIPLIPIPKSQIRFASFTTSPASHNLEVESLVSISANPFYRLLNLCKNLSLLQRSHALLIVNGESANPLLKSKLVGLYGLLGQVTSARQVFDEIPDPDVGSCKVMIRWYFMNDLYEEIIEFFKFMRRRFLVLDNVVFSIVLKACIELRDFGEGRKLHGYIVQMGSPDSFVLTGLVDMYAKCGEVDTARKVFERIWDRNVVCWTSMIVGYVQNNCAKEGLLLFNRMRDRLVEGNGYTLGIIVTACAKLGALHQGKWVHGNVIKNGILVTSYLFTSLLDMYVKCGAVQDARLIFDEVHIIDLFSWTTMIMGYAKNGFADEALFLFTDKKWQDVCPNAITLASVLSACAQSANLNLGSSVHSLGIKLGQDDVNVMNALVDMYAKCRRVGDARNLFESMIEKDVVSWNSIISGYSHNGYFYEALKLYNLMRSNCYRSDPVTVVAVLSASASLGDIRFGSAIHAYSTREGFLAFNSVYVGTALLNLYAKCGDAKSARAVFDEMAEKNTVTWSAMIGGYGKQGDSNECLELFNNMLKENVEPTDIVFTAVLSACSHTGMITEGWRYFDKMCHTYNFIPSTRHYVCMVDLLARSGSLEEAWKFVEGMPVQPDCTILGSFLHGCSMHSRFDLGDLAVRKMLELYPDDAGHYMLMSNLNASRERWAEANQFRDLMKRRGLRKQVGSTRINSNFNHNYQRVASFG